MPQSIQKAAGKTVLVTGGAGFIGSHLVCRLLKDGYQVRVLDNLVTGRCENLEAVQDRIEWIEGSIVENAAVERAVTGVDCIFHHAAIPSVPDSIRDPIGCNEVNVGGTLSLLCAAREVGVRRIVYAASSAAYGDSPVMPKEESMATDPLSPYAVAKVAAENYCKVFYRTYGLETVCLRYFNIFGPRQDPQSEYSAVIPRFVTALLEDREITIYGDGEQSRDFTYIDNAVDANMLAMLEPTAAGEVCNIACGESYTLNELVRVLGEILDVEPRVRYLEARQGDIKHSGASIEKARRILRYEPRVPFREGVQRTVSHFQSLYAGAAESR